MSDPDNLIFGQLRAMEAKLECIADDVREIKGRLTAPEQPHARVQHRHGRVGPQQQPQACG